MLMFIFDLRHAPLLSMMSRFIAFSLFHAATSFSLII